MRLPSNHWLFSGGAVIAIAICLILTSTTSNIENDPSSHVRQEMCSNESKLLRDHSRLAHLFHIIHINCGFLSGELNSNTTIDNIWNLTYRTSASKFVSMDLSLLSRELEELSIAINFTHYNPIKLDFKLLSELLLRVDHMTSIVSGSIKNVPQYQDISIAAGIDEVFKYDPNVYRAYAEKTVADLDDFQSNIDATKMNEMFSPGSTLEADQMRHLKSSYVAMKLIKPKIEMIQFVFSNSTEYLLINETSLNTVSKQLESIQSQAYRFSEHVFEAVKYSKVRKTLEWLSTLVSSLDVSPDESSEFPAILFNESEQFLSKVFRSGENLEHLGTGTDPVRKYSDQLVMLEEHWKRGKNGTMATLQDVIKSFETEEKMMGEKHGFQRSIDVQSCFKYVQDQIKNYLNTDEVKEGNSSLNSFFRSYQRVLESLDDANSKVYPEDYANLMKNIKDVKSSHTDLWPGKISQIRDMNMFEKSQSSLAAMGNVYNFLKDTKLNYSESAKNIADTLLGKIKNVPKSCTLDRFKPDTIENFLLFHTFIGNFQKYDSLRKLDQDLIRPLRKAQVQIRSLSEVSRRIHRNRKNYNVRCNVLCRDMKGTKGHFSNFKKGLKHLKKLWNFVDHLETITKLLTYTDVVVRAVAELRNRASEKYWITDRFEWLEGNMTGFEEASEAIQRLETLHNQREWSNLSSLTEIYEAAGHIKIWSDFEMMYDLMGELIIDTRLNDSRLHEARDLARHLHHITKDLDRRHMAFEDSIESLEILDEFFDAYFKWSVPEKEHRLSINTMAFIYAFSAAGLLCTITFLVWICIDPKRKRTMGPEDRLNDPDFVLTDENRPFWPQLLQCSRLPINQRDQDGYTKLFTVFETLDYEEAERLIKQGAAIDAACGPKGRTVLQEAVERGDKKLVNLLLKYGADRLCKDSDGKIAPMLGNRNYMKGVFAKNILNMDNIIVPKVKRDFYVLILERGKFPYEYVKKLPPALEVVYGFREGEVDLADITHFVMFPRTNGSKDLVVDMNRVLCFELLAKPGMIVSVEWLMACMDDPDEVDNDWKYLLTDITLEKRTHRDVITNIKNDIHRLRPPLLHNMDITILPTEYPFLKTDRHYWIRIIESFGAKHTTHPYPADPKVYPFHYKNDGEFWLYNSVALYFPDSVILERWTWSENCISLMGFAWFVQSIVRYQLISPSHRILRFDPKIESLTVRYEQGWIKDKAGNE